MHPDRQTYTQTVTHTHKTDLCLSTLPNSTNAAQPQTASQPCPGSCFGRWRSWPTPGLTGACGWALSSSLRPSTRQAKPPSSPPVPLCCSPRAPPTPSSPCWTSTPTTWTSTAWGEPPPPTTPLLSKALTLTGEPQSVNTDPHYLTPSTHVKHNSATHDTRALTIGFTSTGVYSTTAWGENSILLSREVLVCSVSSHSASWCFCVCVCVVFRIQPVRSEPVSMPGSSRLVGERRGQSIETGSGKKSGLFLFFLFFFSVCLSFFLSLSLVFHSFYFLSVFVLSIFITLSWSESARVDWCDCLKSHPPIFRTHSCVWTHAHIFAQNQDECVYHQFLPWRMYFVTSRAFSTFEPSFCLLSLLSLCI